MDEELDMSLNRNESNSFLSSQKDDEVKEPPSSLSNQIRRQNRADSTSSILLFLIFG